MNTHENNGGNRSRFTERNHREMYNRYEGENRNRFENREGNRFASREGNRFENREGKGRNFDHRGIVRGNFFEHGRHFGFRRFWHDQWVFLTDWDDCTAWVWLHVAPGVWAWRPVDICIG
jgi:hypothetical protein